MKSVGVQRESAERQNCGFCPTKCLCGACRLRSRLAKLQRLPHEMRIFLGHCLRVVVEQRLQAALAGLSSAKKAGSAGADDDRCHKRDGHERGGLQRAARAGGAVACVLCPPGAVP